MFSSKSGRKWIWAFVDLLVVIIGVYIAFLIQSSAAESNDQKEKIKIFSALKMELEEFRVAFPQFAQSNREYLETLKDKEFQNISGWRFIEPQYGYQIIEYGINIQNTEIINFETYEELKKLYVSIKQLEHSERLITEIAGEYQYLIPELEDNHPLNLEIKANNRVKLSRFKIFLRGRIGVLERTSKISEPLLKQINETLGQEGKKEIDEKYCIDRMGWISSEEQAVELIKKYFPDFSQEEAKGIYKKAKKKKD